MALPPLPEGFSLDAPKGLPPLPEGFTLDGQPQAKTGVLASGLAGAKAALGGAFDPLEGIGKAGKYAANYLENTAAPAVAEKIGVDYGMPKTGAIAGGVTQAIGQMLPQSKLQTALLGLGDTPRLASSGKLAPEAKRIVDIAKEKGIPLTAADITNSQAIAGFESLLAKTPLGGEAIKEYRDSQIQALMRARDALVQKFGPSAESHIAGQTLTDLIKEGSQAGYERSKALYGELEKAIPPGTEIEFKNLQDTAKKLLANEESLPPAFRKSEGLAKLKSIANYSGKEVRNGILDPLYGSGNPPPVPVNKMPLKSVLELRSTLGQDMVDTDAAMKAGMNGMKGLSSKESGIYKQLYGAIESDLDKYSTTQNQGFKDAFDLAKGSYKDFKQTFDNKTIRRLINTNPEKIVDTFIRPNNITEINAIRNAAGAEGFQVVKQKLAEKILGEAGSDMSPTAFNRGLSKYGSTTLKEVFSPNELSEFAKLGELGSTLKTAEKLAGNPSGTGRTVIAASNAGLILAHPVKGSIVVLGQYPASKLYLSDEGRKLLTEGFKVSAESKEGIALAAKISAYLGAKKGE